jgi:hypothetical protein
MDFSGEAFTGETAEGRAVLRDLVNATIGFERFGGIRFAGYRWNPLPFPFFPEDHG